MKKLLLAGIDNLGLYRLFTPFYGGHTSIILLHRVRPAQHTTGIDGGHEVTPGFLEAFIEERTRCGWRFISLDYLLDNFEECSRRKKNLVITLDDGYQDNYRHAYPLFQKYRVPFTIYVTTSFPDGTADLWWYKLASVVNSAEEIFINSDEGTVVISAAVDPRGAFRTLRHHFLSLGREEQAHFLEDLMERYGSQYREERFAMSWDEILQLSRDELCTIGSHTTSHGNLRKLSREEALRDMVLAKCETEQRIGKPVLHFSYPYGTEQEASWREEQLAREAGFKTAVTTRIGNLFDEHIRHLYLLPRVPLQQGAFERLNPIYLSGMYSAIARRFRRVVTH
ncbi:polysaccharide deacetylase family protein [Geomonas subterranea]|uniref:polysaccharide deacetylase family protein n=1 Tax=Geomonas subterranea TaxID=2847989 RepID=UPI001CD63710|nr:polysaccharide deacetylase family protein [Geomonas fuzhouensis]